jgi:hypothetical protein
MAGQKSPDMTRDQRLMVFLSRGLPIPDMISLAPPSLADTPRKSDLAGMAFLPASEGTWQDLSETGKLVVLDSWIDWNGISRRDKRIEFTKLLDASKLPKEVAEQFLDMTKDRFLDRLTAKQPGGKTSLADLKAGEKERKPGRQKTRDRGMDR